MERAVHLSSVWSALAREAQDPKDLAFAEKWRAGWKSVAKQEAAIGPPEEWRKEGGVIERWEAVMIAF